MADPSEDELEAVRLAGLIAKEAIKEVRSESEEDNPPAKLPPEKLERDQP